MPPAGAALLMTTLALPDKCRTIKQALLMVAWYNIYRNISLEVWGVA